MGSPHAAIMATALRQMVNQKLSGAYFSDVVRSISLAVDLNLLSAPSDAGKNTLVIKKAARIAPAAYWSMTGNA